jgi:integrase
MTYTHLVPKRSKSSIHFHFRSKIPKDLISYFNETKQFQISLNNVRNSETLLVSLRLKSIVQQLYSDIRSGMKNLTLEDIKEILRIEVRKSILYSHQVNEETNKHSERGVLKGVEYVLDLEQKLQEKVSNNLGGYRNEVEVKLEGILKSLGITVDKGSVDFKKLRNRFIDLYLMRTSWIKDLVNSSGRSDNDFKREVDEKLNLNLFPELNEQEINSKLQVSESILGSNRMWDVDRTLGNEVSSLSKHQSTRISEGIDKFVGEKSNITNKSVWEIRHTLDLLIQEFGDISLGKLNREMCVKFKDDLQKLPKNRTKLPQYRDLDFHELVKLNVVEKDRISRTTVNNNLGYVSSFMKWCVINGYVDINFFEGMRLKKLIRVRDERDRFEEKELKQIFQKQNYIEFTEVEKQKYEYYWCPLISLFSGMRLNEICSLYLDNIIQVKGNHREKRWCFNILEEPDRPDKHLKTLSSRRIVPIHDILIDLNFLEFVELLKQRHKNRQRLFQELKLSEGSYIRNVSRFFNRRYLTKLGLKTERKTFHSLRHTVIDHLKQQGIDVSFINELVGHSSGNIDLDRYGKGYNSDILYNKCVKKILYQTSQNRGIDFKSLKLDWKKIITTRVW